MAKVEIKLNNAGVRELLQSGEVAKYIDDLAQSIAINAGTGYSARSHPTGQRTIANVYAETSAARRENQNNNTLLKAMRSAKK